MKSLNILKLNVQELNSPPKQTKAFHAFSTFSCGLPTSNTPQSSPKVFSQYPQVYTSSASTKHRVVFKLLFTTPFTLYNEIKYPERRYFLLTGLLLDSEIMIVSYHAPNKNPLSFLSHLFSIVQSYKHGTLVKCGDSNQVIYQILDKSPTTINVQHLFYQQLLNQQSLLDSWCKHNPTRWQYTHYSNPHKQFSRIDHLLVNVSTSPLILDSLIILCAWSDHNSVTTLS